MSPRVAEEAETESGEETGAETGAPSRPRRAAEYPDNEQRIIDTLEKMPPDTRTSIHRLNDRSKEWETHGVLSPPQVSQEWIAEKFGGGTYIVRVKERNKQGKVIVAASATWTIPGRYKGVGDELPGLGNAGGMPLSAPASAAGAAGREQAVPTRELIDSVLTSRMMDVLQSGGKSQGMDLAGIAAIMGAVGTILSPIIERLVTPREAPSDPAVVALLQEMRAERAMARAAGGPTSAPLKDAMRGVRELMSLKELLGGDKDGKLSTEERLMELLPSVVGAFTGRPVPPPQTEISAEVLPVPTNTQPSMTDANGAPDWTAILAPFRDNLLMMASQGWEPPFAAELVERSLPADYTGILGEFLQKPADEQLQLVHTAIPELRAFSKWVPDFLSELRTLFLADEEPEPPAKSGKR